MKKPIAITLGSIAAILVVALWMRWGPDSWDVQITGVTGDGHNQQYRIETVDAGSSNTMIFRNEDAGFLPPYFKFDSADLQAEASRITRECPDTPVTVHGYSMRIAWLSMFPNATSIEAPEHCMKAPTDANKQTAMTGAH